MGGTAQQNAEIVNPVVSGKDAMAHIWAGWAGRRVVLMVFSIVFLIQGIAAFNMFDNYKHEQLDELRQVAHAALVPVINNLEQKKPDVVKKDMYKLLRHTDIRGVAIYGMDEDALIGKYGMTPGLRPVMDMDYARSFLTSDGLFYDVIYTPSEIGQPYNISARLDSSAVSRNLTTYVWKLLGVIFLMSLLITSVLMVAMNQLLLAPMLRRNDKLLKKMHKQAEDKIHRLAYFDSLTGLPNRTYFLEYLDKSIEQQIYGRDSILAVLATDLDHFKDINDSMGHEVGDKVLEVIGMRLTKSLPEEAVVARLSADEFAIMVPLGPDDESCSELAEKVFSSILEPVEVMQENFLLRASIGVSCYPRDGETASDILKHADIALNRAKTDGRGTIRSYSHDFNAMVQQRTQMLRDLRKALQEDQLQLHYHPQFDIKTGEIVGAEALLRWFRPDNSKEGGKFISPAEFVPVAEQSGLIVPIGEWVMRHACARTKAWQDMGVPSLRMAVNISGIQFHRADIVKLVDDVLDKTQLPPEWLELELTESIFIEDTQSAIDIMDELHQRGVQLAVDDFGTGYSSLSYLRQFPIDRLKIDQSFVRASLVSVHDRMIIRAIINLGHSLNLSIIAEGVEMKDHEDLLKEEGCDEVQGFKYSKPLPEDKFLEFVQSYNEKLAESKKVWMVE